MKLKKLGWKALFGVGVTAALAGCGGSTQPVPYVSAGGYYTGTIFFEGSTDDISGLIDEDGDGFLLDASTSGALEIYHLTGSTDGAQYLAKFIAYVAYGAPFPSGKDEDTGTINAVVKERGSITGTYVATDENGAVALVYNTNNVNYALPSSFATIAGTYRYGSLVTPANVATLTIDSMGAITGKDFSGCTYAGTTAIPNAAYNAYTLSLATTCGPTVTQYTGFAFVVTESNSVATSLTLEFDDGVSLSQTGPAIRTGS